MSRPPDKFRSRLKQLLGLKRDTGGSLSPQLPPVVVADPVECDELLKEVHPESAHSLSSRSRILKELCEVVAAKQLEEHAVEAFWLAVKDLLEPENPADVRHITLQFLTSLVTGQYKNLKLLRAHFFTVIEDHNIAEDLTHRLQFLQALTLNGKDIEYFEERIGPFLLSLMPSVVFNEKLDIFLPLLRNFIRYNSSYLDEDVISGLVKQTCQICTTTDKEKEVEQLLTILDAVVRYSSLPSSALYSFLVAVCCTVNIEQFCQPSWRLMRHLLGTHLGHNGVLTMCCILEDSNNWAKVSLLRGAIFFVGMCLWGSKKVTSLHHKPIAVLPSFYKVLSCDNENVICEVTLSMQRLVKKYGMKQHDSAWESILDIASALQEYVERHPSCTTVPENFHVLLSYIEDLHEKHEFHGSADKLFTIVAKCTKNRPESSVILLVSHRAQSLHPYCDNWFENIKDLVDKYFKCEERTAIRIKVLDVLCNILGKFSPLYEEEILENSVLPYLDQISKDQDIAVRVRAVQLLVDVIEGSDSPKVYDVLHLIEKVAYCPVDPLKRHVRASQHGSNKEQCQDEKSLEDIKEAVLGLVRLFKVKLFRKPQEQAERIFNILVYHIKAHYDNGYRTYIASQIRLAILECFLNLRADSCHRLGMVQEDSEEAKFSSYFTCTERKSSSEDKSSGLVSLAYSEAMNVILLCLQQELEWEVLDVVLKIIPETLQDKNLILSGKQYLSSICTVLSKMVSNYDFLTGLFRVPHEMRRPHLYSRIFPVLTELCTYHPFIGQDEQFCLMHTMEIGLVAHSAALCVSCLTICMLEVPFVLARLLPTYLEKFAKLSPTPQVAIPLLEFLSALSHLRELYTNFTAVQLKQVFGICLPYTESSRYSQYTVTLAHNVICSWYVNCPLLLRKQFVAFITKSLKDTVISSKTPTPYSRVPTSPTKLQPPPTFPEKPNEDSSNTLSSEMVEIAVDMMVKHTFSSSLTEPKRTAVVDQLLANGSSRSWLLGNVLVTVTVSKRTPSNMPCAYCSSGKTLFSESLPRVRSGSTSQCSPGAKSATTDHTSVESEGLPDIRHQVLFDKENITPQDTANIQPSNTCTPQQASLKSNANGTSSPTVEPQTTSTVSSQEKSRDSTSECSCVCQGWAEFLVRRPTGNTSWILRLQNRPKLDGSLKQTPRPAMEQTAPQIYESIIPKQFFDDLTAELTEERARQRLAVTTGLLSKSADSDTLIVELVRDRLQTDQERNGSTDGGLTSQRPKEALSSHSQREEDTGDTNAELGGTREGEKVENHDDGVKDGNVQGSGNVEQKVSFTKDIDKSSLTSQDSRSSLGTSFVERTRYLSRSPMDGPSAFMLLDGVQDSKDSVSVESDAEQSSQDLPSQDEFQKPVVGKSPLDASPLKTFLSQDGTGFSDSDDDILASSDTEELSLNQEDENNEPSHSLISTNVCDTPDTNDVTPAHATNSLPASRAQSPLSGLGLRNRISESRGGSVSLPATPLSSRTKSPEFFDNETSRKTSRNGSRTVSPAADVTGRKTPTEKASLKQKKSATVDLGMLRRTSSSPEIDIPVKEKEKRGLMKLFDNVSDKEKKRPAVMRRQTMSGSEISRKKVKRRSYNGPFPDNDTKGYERNAEEVTNTYDALRPNFIFLQFYHSSWFGEDDIPLALPEEEFYHRAVKNLDRIPPYDTHKIGVIYVGPDQGHDEVSILRNQYGSSRYMEFISGLGELVRLRDCSLCEVYTGGLDRNGADGEYAYSWRSEIAQVMFHIATLMPNKEKDPNCHSKKLHIGNDFVTIVYNDSKSAYKMGTIKGQFNFVEIVIKPLDNESNVVCLNVKDELKDILVNTNDEPRVISDKNLPTLVRHMALHVNMASVIHKSQKTPTDAYGCNWLQRLRQIKRIRSRIPATVTEPESLVSRKDLYNIVDFTKYILQ